jgi:hypothetical protein
MILSALIRAYQTDPDSPYQTNRYHTRVWRDGKLRQLAKLYGTWDLKDIRARTLLAWHREWACDGAHVPNASSMIGQLRAMFSFGATMLENRQCKRLAGDLHLMRFKGSKPRDVSVTAEQANMIRAKAHEFGWGSIALGQAFQFEGTLRQRDVIGCYEPLSEPGLSAIMFNSQKWLRGIVWQEIDSDLILRHVTSKKQKLGVTDLKLAPMVMEELQLMVGSQPLIVIDEATKKVTVNRYLLPVAGPIIVNELNGRPWSANEYRRKWRIVARAYGIADNVKNMDSRSGAISEAITAGVPLELVRHAALHSDILQTADYDRTQQTSTATTMRMRVESRSKQNG